MAGSATDAPIEFICPRVTAPIRFEIVHKATGSTNIQTGPTDPGVPNQSHPSTDLAKCILTSKLAFPTWQCYEWS